MGEPWRSTSSCSQPAPNPFASTSPAPINRTFSCCARSRIRGRSSPGRKRRGARWPDAHSGEQLRIEHWVVAERQGQTAARNMLGQRQRFSDVPFFWSQHHDVPINYIGHAASWDGLDIEGSIEARDCLVRYRRDGKVLAVASIFRDTENLKEEAAMEHVRARA